MKKRVEIRMEKELYKILFNICEKRNISMTKLVIRSIVEKLIRDRDIESVSKN